MTRDQQIKQALELLEVRKLPLQEQAQWRLRIERALADMVGTRIWADIYKFEHSKAISRALNSYHRAARRLQAADKMLRTAIERQGLAVYPSEWATALIAPAAIACAIEASALTPKPKAPITKGKPEQFEIYGKAMEPTREKLAVALARRLLQHRGLKIVTTRGGTWWRLSRTLLDRDVDLFRHMREYARA